MVVIVARHKYMDDARQINIQKLRAIICGQKISAGGRLPHSPHPVQGIGERGRAINHQVGAPVAKQERACAFVGGHQPNGVVAPVSGHQVGAAEDDITEVVEIVVEGRGALRGNPLPQFAARGIVNQRSIAPDPQPAPAADAVGVGEQGGHQAVGVQPAHLAVAGIEHINRAVATHPQAIGQIHRHVGARVGRVRAIADGMGAGDGVDAAVRGDLQNRIAVLVHDEHIAGVVRHGKVRAGKRRIGGVTAFKTGLPVIDSVLPGLRAAPRDRMQQAVRLHQIREGRRRVAGKVRRQHAEKCVARRRGKTARAGGIRGEEVLPADPGRLAVGAVELGCRLHRANPAGKGVRPGQPATGLGGRDAEIISGGRCQHRQGHSQPKQIAHMPHIIEFT